MKIAGLELGELRLLTEVRDGAIVSGDVWVKRRLEAEEIAQKLAEKLRTVIIWVPVAVVLAKTEITVIREDVPL
jgi:hypothetical protein